MIVASTLSNLQIVLNDRLTLLIKSIMARLRFKTVRASTHCSKLRRPLGRRNCLLEVTVKIVTIRTTALTRFVACLNLCRML